MEEESLKQWREKAERGDADAQNSLGVLLDNEGNPECVQWYEKAAAQNNRWALRNLGLAYYEGYPVKQDQDKAIEYWGKVIELVPDGDNDTEVLYYLWKHYFNNGNYEKANDYLSRYRRTKYHELKDGNLSYADGEMSFNGLDKPWNYKQAYQDFQFAANNNQYDAMIKLNEINNQLATNGQYETDEKIVEKLTQRISNIMDAIQETTRDPVMLRTSADVSSVNIKLSHEKSPTKEYEGKSNTTEIYGLIDELLTQLARREEFERYIEILRELKTSVSDDAILGLRAILRETSNKDIEVLVKLKRLLGELLNQSFSCSTLGEYDSGSNTITLYVSEIKNLSDKNDIPYADNLLRVFAHELFHAYHYADTRNHNPWDYDNNKIVIESLARYFEYYYCENVLKNAKLKQSLIKDSLTHDMNVYPYSGAKYFMPYEKFYDLKNFALCYNHSLRSWDKARKDFDVMYYVDNELA